MARALSATTGALHYVADMFFVRDGAYRYDPRDIGKAHEWCQLAARRALEAGADVIVSNTFTRNKEIKPYLEMAKMYRADFRVIVATGSYRNIHGVPQDAIDRMRSRWEELDEETVRSIVAYR